MNARTIFLLSISFVIVSCKNDTTGPPPGVQQFSVSISVKNSAGTPVPGIRISVFNKFSVMFLLDSPQAIGMFPSTTIRFSVPATAIVDLIIFDMDGTPVDTLLQNYIVREGAYQANMSVTMNKPTRVFKCRLVARDSISHTLVFRDSIYAVLHQPDASISVAGWTSSNGTFQTNDSLLFPNVLSLPPIGRRNSNGQDLGMFSIPDSIVIQLTDTLANRTQTFYQVVTKGSNSLQLTWSPSAVQHNVPIGDDKVEKVRLIKIERLSLSLIEWKLNQNFPNPFN